MHFATLALACALTGAPASSVPPTIAGPTNPRITATEKTLEITWDTVADAQGYNVYTAPRAGLKLAQRRKVNPGLITSGPRFTYIWDLVRGTRERNIKGFEHHLSVTAIVNDRIRKKTYESLPSAEVDNCCFDGFRNVQSRADIYRLLQNAQTSEKLPVEQKPTTVGDFMAFMDGPGKLLFKTVKDSLNFKETGGCAPVSTVLVNVLDTAGIYAYKVEGTFIKEFHTFVVVNIDGVEYILDFTADQFVPGVSPVFLPRDKAFLTEANRFGSSGTPVYQVAKIFNPGQCLLSDSPDAEVYRHILEKVVSSIPTKGGK